ncbi:hypothetical protein NQ315_001153 [Exocentrus adspersus]|uniref:VWFC domain-containing protein n=1 Tax=Exocentrus adspersus TaxID=1586481 RepID=A0AAV8WEN7_9CUCU|nr:hypothetical protein NQ315_001153 [Exocentrus adspersus]
MAWKVLLLISILGVVTDRAYGGRKRRWESRPREAAVIYAVPDERCPYPCQCPAMGEECGECEECPRQAGEPCSKDKPCDVQRSLVCRYKHGDAEGVCRESFGVPCVVYNKTYEHGETFTLDCRTQCACQNGTYGCSSLCPQEHISPRGSCQHPRLVEVPGQCCREWMCDSQTAEQPPSCQPAFSRWSTCSSDCGSGLSNRRSNLNARCQPDTETRICQTRRCLDTAQIDYRQKHHHLRRGHECKATHRLSSAVFLRFGPCRSRKRFRPKYCGVCPIPGVSCQPTLSTTVKVEFFCEGSLSTEHASELLPEYLEPGADLWADDLVVGPEEDSVESKLMTVLVQWVLKCRCAADPSAPTSSTGEVVLHRVHRTAAP